MPPQYRPLELEQLCQKFDQDFAHLIKGIGHDDTARRSNFCSKAIAAFVLCAEAGATPEQAAAASIDGGQDHGIDSVFVSADQTLWLVQSKYHTSGHGEPILGDVSKFRDGVTDLLRGRLERFNAALRSKEIPIKQALDMDRSRVRVILAHSGSAVSDDRRQIFGDLERAFNGTHSGFLQCSTYGLSSLHGLLLANHAPQPIEEEVVLQDYGCITAPYRAFYGRLSANQLAALSRRHGANLVERNIRRFKGSTSVNDGLAETLKQSAEHFFYFNNGVTFLCESIREGYPRDPHRQEGCFRVSGLSIINGAQTVGAIAREEPGHYVTHPVEVLATFICLENAPYGFGDQVTQSRNRQNAVELEDFAALDERQALWQRTLKLQGIDYLIKQGDEDPLPSATVFSIQEAAPALACTLPDRDWVDFVVMAKSERRKLFTRSSLVSNQSGVQFPAYERLFIDSLTARSIWRAVQVSRFVRSHMSERARTESDPATLPPGTLPVQEILRHGSWLLLHVLFVRTELHNGVDLTLTEEELQRLSLEFDNAVLKLAKVVQTQQWGKQARSLFTNKTDCQTIKRLLMAALNQPAQEYP
ncbi:AIPR family protein [Stutzerimonas sp. NM35]